MIKINEFEVKSELIDISLILEEVNKNIDDLFLISSISGTKNIYTPSIYWNIEYYKLELENSYTSILLSELIKTNTKEDLYKIIEENFNENLQEYFEHKILMDTDILSLICKDKYSFKMYSIDELLEINKNNLFYFIYENLEKKDYKNSILLNLNKYIQNNFNPNIHNKNNYIDFSYPFAYYYDIQCGYNMNSSITTEDLFKAIFNNEDYYKKIFHYNKQTNRMESPRGLTFFNFLEKTSLDELIDLNDLITSFDSDYLNKIYNHFLIERFKFQKLTLFEKVKYKLKLHKLQKIRKVD